MELRDGDTLDDLVGPFDKMAHSADVRSVNAKHFSVFGNIPDIDVFVWRLKTQSITQAPKSQP